MGGVTFGDIVFILFVGAVIYGIMALVNRSRKKKEPGEKEGGGEEEP